MIADGGLELRPMMVKVLAQFTNEDYIQFNDSKMTVTGESRGGRSVTIRAHI